MCNGNASLLWETKLKTKILTGYQFGNGSLGKINEGKNRIYIPKGFPNN